MDLNGEGHEIGRLEVSDEVPSAVALSGQRRQNGTIERDQSSLLSVEKNLVL
jgi:hypothetical protein